MFLGRDFNQTKNYSEETASIIDSEVKDIITKAYDDAKRILEANMDRLHFVAAYLMKNEIMEEEQFVRAMTEKDVTIEQLEEMVAEKRRNRPGRDCRNRPHPYRSSLSSSHFSSTGGCKVASL